jgi:hypothetical protein
MAEAVDELMVKLGLEPDAKGFREANNQFAAIRTSALATGAAITGAFAGMVSISNDVAKSGDDLAKWSRSAGVAAQFAHKLGFAMKQVGGSDADARALIELANSWRDSAQWGELPTRAFTAAGFNPQQIQQQNMDAPQTIDFVGRALSAMPLDQRRQIASSLGANDKAFRLLSDYAGMNNSFRRADQLGAVPSDELLKNAEAYVTATSELGELIDGFKKSIASEMLPGMTRIVEGINGWSIENRDEIEAAFQEAMPYFKTMATGIAVLVAAQVGKKGLAAMGGAGGATGLMAKAGIIGIGMSAWNWDAEILENATGIRVPDWVFGKFGAFGGESDSAPAPSAPPAPRVIPSSAPPAPPAPRVIPRSTDRTPSAPPATGGLTPDEMNYIPSPGEILPQGTDAEFIEGNRRLMRGHYPSACASPPDMSRMNPQASTTYSPTINVDARGSTDPLMTEQRVRRVIDNRIGEIVKVSLDGISNNVV